MRFKVLILTALAVVTMLVPTAGVFAADTLFWSGAATVNVGAPTFTVSATSRGTVIPSPATYTLTVPVGATRSQTIYVQQTAGTSGYSIVPNITITDSVGNPSSALALVTSDVNGVPKAITNGGEISFTYGFTAAVAGTYTVNLTFSYR